METQNNISPCKKYIIIFFLKKNPLKENKILQDIYYNSIITNLKVSTQAKNIIFPKILILKKMRRDLLLLLLLLYYLGGQNPLSYYIL
jgi:hypothetical protein